MSKIKNFAKGVLYSVPILVGADKVLAQDINQIASDNSKKIEIAQSVKVDTTLEKIKVNWPGNYIDDQDTTNDYNQTLMEVENTKIGDKLVRSNVAKIKIIPDKKNGFYQSPSLQIQEAKDAPNGIISASDTKLDTTTTTLRDKRKPNLETITVNSSETPKADLDTSNGFKNNNNYNQAKIKVENIKLGNETAKSDTGVVIIKDKKYGFFQDPKAQSDLILEGIRRNGLGVFIDIGTKADTSRTILIPNKRNIIYSKDPEVTFAGNGSIKVKYTAIFPLTPLFRRSINIR